MFLYLDLWFFVKQNSNGVMKVKKLRKEVGKALKVCGIAKDKDQLHDELMSKVWYPLKID
jgi:hypothetical protein